MSTFTAHIVTGRRILSPIIYAGFYGTYCLLSSHIVAGDSVCSNRRVCLQVVGEDGGGGGYSICRTATICALNVVVYCRPLLSVCIYFVYI